MTADQLRRALETDGKLIGRGGIEHPFVTAARFKLSLLEADETTVEKVAAWLYGAFYYEPGGLVWYRVDVIVKERLRAKARELLAAIVGEET